MTCAHVLLRYLGRRYRWGGGALADGLDRLRAMETDCSGFAQAAMLEMGIVRPDAWHDLRAVDIANACILVDPSNVQPGDMAFYARPVSHVMVVFDVPDGDGREVSVIGACGGNSRTTGNRANATVQIRPARYRSDFTCFGRLRQQFQMRKPE